MRNPKKKQGKLGFTESLNRLARISRIYCVKHTLGAVYFFLALLHIENTMCKENVILNCVFAFVSQSKLYGTYYINKYFLLLSNTA